MGSVCFLGTTEKMPYGGTIQIQVHEISSILLCFYNLCPDNYTLIKLFSLVSFGIVFIFVRVFWFPYCYYQWIVFHNATDFSVCPFFMHILLYIYYGLILYWTHGIINKAIVKYKQWKSGKTVRNIQKDLNGQFKKEK